MDGEWKNKTNKIGGKTAVSSQDKNCKHLMITS
jgi:hypothetical protein